MSISNRQAICETLLKAAAIDKDIVVLCSDSRGSASLAPFAEKYPEQFVEVGIAEQNLVSVAAGMAACGKKAFAASPACFLSTRSYEQAKVDVAYSNTNVKFIGISGGVSYGALGMTHHSLQDIAAFSALPDMRVYLPSDAWQTARLFENLLQDKKPAYIRVSRNASPALYGEGNAFAMDKATVLKEGRDALLVGCGETVSYAKRAAEILEGQGVSCTVLDMYSIKPLDCNTLLKYAESVKLVVTVEEHSVYGGLGAQVAQIISRNCPKKVVNLAFPDTHLVAGTDKELFAHYGLDEKGIIKAVTENL